MLTPFLNNRRESIRQAVVSCYSAVFKDDKRGEITIEVGSRTFFLMCYDNIISTNSTSNSLIGLFPTKLIKERGH